MKVIFQLLVITFYILNGPVWSQESIQGQIIDGTSGEGIESVNIFIANSSIGTATNSNGDFVLNNIPNHAFALIASHVSYQTHFQRIEASSKLLIIKLSPSTINLN